MNNSYLFIRSSTARRRGVILLVVLGLMIMFSLLVLTFMVVTSQSWRMSDSHQKFDAVVDYRSKSTGETDAWSGMLEVLRGSTRTSIGIHSILENLYGHPEEGTGNDLLRFTVVNASYINNSGWVDYAPEATVDENENTYIGNQLIGLQLAPQNASVSQVYDIMGNVLTVPDVWGDQPARIVKKVTLVSGNIGVTVYPPYATTPGNLGGNTCLVNGAPYSGTGIGYITRRRAWQPQLSETDNENFNQSYNTQTGGYANNLSERTDLPLAVRPNLMAPNASNGSGRYDGYKNYVENNHIRMNVDYTAPDVNSMFLGWVNWNKNNNSNDWRSTEIIPSFLRPALMRYLVEQNWAWRVASSGQASTPLTHREREDQIRKVVLRPLPFDHPNFSGSNPAWKFDLDAEQWNNNNNADAYKQNVKEGGHTGYIDSKLEENGNQGQQSGALYELARLCAGLRRDGTLPNANESVFDVDNDGDGIKEGIWIDAGLPVRMSSDGKWYKPLISVTILDMDGRVNVNVHGNPVQLSSVTDFGNNNGQHNDPNWSTLRKQTNPPRGAGSGPAGVRLAYALNEIYSESGENEAANLMFGTSIFAPGRYGYGNNSRPGEDNSNVRSDLLADLFVKYFPYDGNSRTEITSFGGVGPDLWDMAAVAYDPLGHKLSFPSLLDTNSSQWRYTVNWNPYIFDPHHVSSVYSNETSDMRFTASELADLLRGTDVDYKSLPKRLSQLLGGSNDNDYYGSSSTLAREGAKFLTTMSNDIPLPNRRMGRDRGIYSLLYRCIEDQVRQNGGDPDNVNGIATVVEDLIKVLPEEIRNGEKLDLNKLAQRPNWNNTPYAVTGANTFDSTTHILGLQEKSDYARGIYLLLMAMSYDQLYGFQNANGTVIDPYFEPAFAQEDRLDWRSDNNAAKKELCRQVMATRLAQYAVNLVDYADPDATMTPLVFDVDPFAVVFQGNGNTNLDTSMSGWYSVTSATQLQHDTIGSYKGNNDSSLGFGSTFYPYYNGRVSAEDFRHFLTEDKQLRRGGVQMCRGRVVYGMERSDLVLTETFATHDLGVADTASDDELRDNGKATTTSETDEAKRDPHFDQVKMPQASAWFELYCTTDQNQPSQPQDIYDFDSSAGKWRLNLGQQAPDMIKGKGRSNRMYPVWQMSISESTDPLDVRTGTGVNDKKKNNIALRLADSGKQPITFSMQTEQPTLEVGSTAWTLPDKFFSSILGPTDNGNDVDHDVAIDRFVWFYHSPVKIDVDPDPERPSNNDTFPDCAKIFWGRGTGNNLEELTGGRSATVHHLYPNEYMIIAPRMTTWLGSLTLGGAVNDYGFPSGESVDLKSTSGGNSSPTFGGAPTPRVLVAATLAPSNWYKNGAFLEKVNDESSADYDHLVKIANLGIGVRNSASHQHLGIGLNISAPMPNTRSGSGGDDPYTLTTNSKYYAKPETSAPQNIATIPTGADSGNGYHAFYNNRSFYDIYNASGTREITSMVKGTGASQVYPDKPFDLEENVPIEEDKLYGTGTIPMYRSVVLQRLSDPNLPYHPLMNPYITIDWNMIDLNVFTGEGDQYETDGDEVKAKESTELLSKVTTVAAMKINDQKTEESLDSSAGVSTTKKDVRFRLASRQWGRTGMPFRLRDKLIHPNPWNRVLDADLVADSSNAIIDSRVLDASLITTTKTPTDAKLWSTLDRLYVPHRPQHSLGRLNWMYSDKGTTSVANSISTSVFLTGSNLGKIVLPRREPDTDPERPHSRDPDGVYYGAPVSSGLSYIPFVNHPWNNSPYSNPYEVMSVPASSPGRFGLEFVDLEQENFQRLRGGTFPDHVMTNRLNLTNNNPEFATGSLGSGSRFGYPLIGLESDSQQIPKATNVHQAGLGHVLNFYHSSLNYRVDDHFNYEEKNLSMNLGGFLDHIQVPSRFRGTKLWLDTSTNNIPYGISTYREPGRMNINTMSKPAWTAALNDRELPEVANPNSGQTGNLDPYTCLYNSRSFGTADEEWNWSGSPLDFAYPFRSQSMSTIVPDVSIDAVPLTDQIDNGANTDRNILAAPADVTLLRRIGNRDMSEALMTPRDLENIGDLKIPYGQETEGLQRLSSITTTRSNVFAVWMTVGYFEATQVDFDDKRNKTGRDVDQLKMIYPDGYEFGEELGYSTGDIVRHRSFYLIDRTIPVGFRRGQSTNVSDTVILKTAVE